ncbi:MAG: glucuronate isomerase [Oscillospiraceae bacterium]|nr:glucuronate isomerase [Oscillospiraceae bacterium]
MKKFLDKNFLLDTPTAQALFHDHAKQMPIIDYHCHIDPKEIAQDRQFRNITEVWLGGDHYKWRLMRSAGVDEYYITGGASDREKFGKWAEVLSRAVGNPLYHWSHLELQRFFGYYGTLTPDTAQEVWELTEKKLASPEMSVRGLIKMSGVDVICTTDDPVDSLEWHRAIAEDKSFETKVYPAWRPDKAMNIEKPDFPQYIAKVSDASGITVNSFELLIKALSARMDFFDSMGCKVSDHGNNYVSYVPADRDVIEAIFSRGMKGIELTPKEIAEYKTAFMLEMGRQYSARGWVMQLHYGAKRDNNVRMYDKLGPDTGFDSINNYGPAAELADFLNALEYDGQLPRTIIYSLDPHANQVIDTLIGCFQSSEAVSKIQHGSAWWFNDHKTGMTEQLTSLGNLGYLAGFVGMLTDSRSFLSYPRHEYFRRILCNYLGNLVENGEFPADMDTLGSIVRDISYNNAKRYFRFGE